MAHIDWGMLVDTGRAKAWGISWNEDEVKARYAHMIPAEFVREGILTLEAYAQARAEVEKSVIETKKRPIRYMTKEDLVNEAQACGAEYSLDMTRGDLILAIQNKQQSK